MTLLLGILTEHCVAVATDGYSIRTHYDGTRVVEKTDLRKSFPLNENTILVHHGENILLDKPIEQMCRELPRSITRVRSPFKLGYRLFPIFDPILRRIGRHLARVRSSFGLWIVGYDKGPFLHELHWDSTLHFGRKLFPVGDIVWAGNGARFAEEAFKNNQFGKRCIREFSKPEALGCLRELYEKALKLQGTEQLFGGDYQEATINAHDCV